MVDLVSAEAVTLLVVQIDTAKAETFLGRDVA